jgi:hypothetical protein
MSTDTIINDTEKNDINTRWHKFSKVVARYADGRLLKGYTRDFYPDKRTFHVFSSKDVHDGGEVVEVLDLKAIFFVKEFTGDRSYNERKSFLQNNQPVGRKIEVTFMDGEVLIGTTIAFAPYRIGFFLFPADMKSNNMQIFVIMAAVRKVCFLD